MRDSAVYPTDWEWAFIRNYEFSMRSKNVIGLINIPVHSCQSAPVWKMEERGRKEMLNTSDNIPLATFWFKLGSNMVCSNFPENSNLLLAKALFSFHGRHLWQFLSLLVAQGKQQVSKVACSDPSTLQAHATLHKTSRDDFNLLFFPDGERRCPATASSYAELHFMGLLTMLSVGGTVKNIFENNVHCLDVKWFVTLQMSTFFDCWYSRYDDYSTLRLKNTLFILRSDYFGNKGIVVLFPGICTMWLNLLKVCSRIEMFPMESKHQWVLS